jgi:hypothetical protein
MFPVERNDNKVTLYIDNPVIMLLRLMKPPALALQALEAAQRSEPKRFKGLDSAARAAKLAGAKKKPARPTIQLVALAELADSARPSDGSTSRCFTMAVLPAVLVTRLWPTYRLGAGLFKEH